MTSPRLPPESLPDWPRFLSRPLAAAYLGIGEQFFTEVVTVAPVALGGRKVWDRRALDAWADAKAAEAARNGGDWVELLDAGTATAG